MTFSRADSRVNLSFPTFRGVTPSPSSGYAGGFVEPNWCPAVLPRAVCTLRGVGQVGDGFSPRNVRKPSHLPSAVCQRKLHWILSPWKLQNLYTGMLAYILACWLIYWRVGLYTGTLAYILACWLIYWHFGLYTGMLAYILACWLIYWHVGLYTFVIRTYGDADTCRSWCMSYL